MRSLLETKKSVLHVQAKINVVRQLDEDYVKMIQRGEDLKREVHEFVSNLFPTVEAEKQAIYKAVKRNENISLFTENHPGRVSARVDPISSVSKKTGTV